MSVGGSLTAPLSPMMMTCPRLLCVSSIAIATPPAQGPHDSGDRSLKAFCPAAAPEPCCRISTEAVSGISHSGGPVCPLLATGAGSCPPRTMMFPLTAQHASDLRSCVGLAIRVHSRLPRSSRHTSHVNPPSCHATGVTPNTTIPGRILSHALVPSRAVLHTRASLLAPTKPLYSAMIPHISTRAATREPAHSAFAFAMGRGRGICGETTCYGRNAAVAVSPPRPQITPRTLG
mmetsp:Transcript_12829/g.31182  ORF Transcript_12829/g.31182 Transcript_12829/m.31182 type:complete len:233 (+) Transcript_12829:226-924(+)